MLKALTCSAVFALLALMAAGLRALFCADMAEAAACMAAAAAAAIELVSGLPYIPCGTSGLPASAGKDRAVAAFSDSLGRSKGELAPPFEKPLPLEDC